MAPEPVFYSRPSGEPFTLKVAPRLASWNRADHPDQLRLASALEHAVDVLGPRLMSSAGPLTMCLEVGLPDATPSLDEHDLDNYLYPFATYLEKRSDGSFVSAWCRKVHGERSLAMVEPAVARVVDQTGLIVVRTTASGATAAYKEQIDEQLNGADELPDGPISLELSFVVGPARNWLNLWKPTIDALERLLGRTRPDRAWHPRDGRIIELGLHCLVDSDARHQVTVAIKAAAVA